MAARGLNIWVVRNTMSKPLIVLSLLLSLPTIIQLWLVKRTMLHHTRNGA